VLITKPVDQISYEYNMKKYRTHVITDRGMPGSLDALFAEQAADRWAQGQKRNTDGTLRQRTHHARN